LTALYELIKNCYDANAREVYLDFFNVSSHDGKITIKDDGIGMSLWDFRNKWMVISTGAKRLERTSPPPFYRVLLGEKGIGRFAVDKLASKVIIRTKRAGMSQWLLVEIDWSKYDNIKNNGVIDRKKLKNSSPGVDALEKAEIIYPSEHKEFFYWSEDIESEEELIIRIEKAGGKKDPDYLAAMWKETHKIYLTDIEHKISSEPAKLEEHGTELILNPLRETWDKDDIERVYWELTIVLPPDSNLGYGFKIILNSNEHPGPYKNKVVVNRAIDFATEFVEIEGTEDCQERIEFDDKKGKLKKVKGNVEKFGPIRFKLYYFDQYGKANFRKHYKYFKIDGSRKIKISLLKEGGEKIPLLFSDNCIGIPPENRDKIYEVYFTTTADQGGAGLGLYIVKNFLKSYKGEISLVNSEFKPHGASFKITLPIKKEDQNE
jgi:hypothetical protein